MAKKIKPITAWAVYGQWGFTMASDKKEFIKAEMKRLEKLGFRANIFPVRITPINPKSV